MGPGEVAWDVDRYNLPHGEEMAAVLIYVSGGETVHRRREAVRSLSPTPRATDLRSCRPRSLG
jgi:hypothetical protein